MDKKVLLIAVIVFALIFVVLMAVLMGTVTNKTNAANTKLVDTLDMTEGMELSNYDGATMKGNAVINAINNGKSLGGKTKLWIYVITKGNGDAKNTHGEIYGYADTASGTGTGSFGAMYYSKNTSKANNGGWVADAKAAVKDTSKSTMADTILPSANYRTYSAPLSTEANFINESAEFSSYLVRNVNDVVVGIYFVQLPINE